MKPYKVFDSGSAQIATINATCITKAVKQFVATLDKQTSYSLQSSQQASISYSDSYSAMSDFVIYES